MLAGYRGGKLDVALSRVADVMMSIPPLILVLIFIFVVGSSNLSIVLLTGLVTQQMSNDPGGDRWARLIDRAVDMFVAAELTSAG